MTAIKFLNRPDLSKKQYLDPQTMIEGVNRYIRAQQGKTQLKSTPGYLQLVVKNVEQAVHAKDNGNFCALHSTQFPIEFFWPLGIMPLFNELYSTIVGIIGDDNQQFLSISDDIGFPCYICSYHRTFYGMAEVGAWPTPDFVVYSSSPCDSTPKGLEMAAKALGVPSFGLDRPYKIFTPQSMDYWLKEHRALIRFLEEQTGRRMDYDLLKEVTQLSYRATQVYREINELRRAVPCPMPAEAAFAPMAVYRAWAGTQTCIDFLEQLRDELTERVAKGIGAVPQEKFRYTYATSLPFFDLGIMAETEKRFGAVNVMDHLQWWREDADWLIDSDDPLASLAYRVQFGTSNSLHGTAMDHAEEVRQAALKCKADGVVYFNNRGCRHAAGGYRISKDTIERSLGIPWATINCDMLDKSFTSFDEVMDQLDVFFETVENGRAYQERTRQRGQPTDQRMAAA
jgi:benzoyl-CoA reductase/2-hydroxyglutaryl-CoA dehydratase subunit BcrC/BadD/HgdB